MTVVSRRAVLAGAASAAMAPKNVRAESVATPRMAPAIGINLAGADFGDIPGRHGREYLYPEEKNFAFWAEQGFTLIRLPFKWERLQPQLGAPFDAQELSLLRTAVAHGTRRGLVVVLDPHNYAKRRLADDTWAREHVIGSTAVPSQAFADFWTRLAADFAHEPLVHFGLMNEPTSVSPQAWRDIAREALAAIRQAGATNRVYVPGTDYTGAHSWLRVGNDILESLHAPGRDVVFEVHQYLDSDSSGTHAQAVSSSVGAERLAQFQTWARGKGSRGFLGEFGASEDEHALRALIDMLDEVAAHPEVWTGVAAWAGGPRWPHDALFNLEPDADTRTRPQAAILTAFARGQPPLPRYKGLAPAIYFDRRRSEAASPDLLRQLTELCARDPFTLMIDIMATDLARPQPLVQQGGIALLAIAGGCFRSDCAADLVAMPVLPGSTGPGQRVRCALSIDRSKAEAHMVATGGAHRSATMPLRREQGAADISYTNVVRLVAFARAFAPDDLADMVV